jgi:hypothetical protein
MSADIDIDLADREQLLQLISSIRKDITQIKILYENGIYKS